MFLGLERINTERVSVRRFSTRQLILIIGMCLILNCRSLLIIHMTGKLTVISRNEYNIIMKHLWSKATLGVKEWVKIYKALHAFEFLL